MGSARVTTARAARVAAVSFILMRDSVVVLVDLLFGDGLYVIVDQAVVMEYYSDRPIAPFPPIISKNHLPALPSSLPASA